MESSHRSFRLLKKIDHIWSESIAQRFLSDRLLGDENLLEISGIYHHRRRDPKRACSTDFARCATRKAQMGFRGECVSAGFATVTARTPA